MSKIKAVIFDCDGVLVDSELVSCQLSVEYLKNKGHTITLEEFMNNFLGVTFEAQMKKINESRVFNGLEIIPISEEEIKQREKNKVKVLNDSNIIKPIEGVVEFLTFLKQHNIPFAIASGSGPDKLDAVLNASGLIKYFDKDLIINSKSEGLAEFKVEGEASKVAIFKLANKRLKEKYKELIKPQECLVIEDAENGIKAAKAANMEVWGFTGAGHMKNSAIRKLNLKIQSGDAFIFNKMDDIKDKILLLNRTQYNKDDTNTDIFVNSR